MVIKKKILNLARKLISFQSYPENKLQILKLFEYVESLFNKKLYKITRMEFDGQPIIWIEPKIFNSDIYLVGHVDVVHGIEKQFKPQFLNNKIYGRGAFDMKTQDAILIHLSLQNNVGLILTSDEEVAKIKNSAWYIAKKLKRLARLVIIPDGEHKLGITTKIKGIAEIEITARGKATRYSYPWRGENPHIKLMKFYLSLNKVFTNSNKAKETDPWYSTYNLLSFVAPELPKVPDTATMKIIANLTNKDDKKKIIKNLNLLGKAFDCSAKLSFWTSPYEVSAKDKHISLFKKILDKESGTNTPLLTLSASSDVRHFNDQGIKTILTRINGGDPHGPKEYSDLNSSVILYNALDKFLSAYHKIA